MYYSYKKCHSNVYIQYHSLKIKWDKDDLKLDFKISVSLLYN